MSDEQEVAALQAALRAVNAAIYGYGVAGAQLPAAQLPAAQQDWTRLQETRDTLESLLTSQGAQPDAAAAAYRLPFPVHTVHAALSLAGYLEEQLAGAYLGLVALPDPQLRAWGARQAQGCAIRAAGWLGRTSAFPGLSTPGSAAVPSPAGTSTSSAARTPSESRSPSGSQSPSGSPSGSPSPSGTSSPSAARSPSPGH
ncbi:MAG: ferritin-like domain-containing protein [Streptosporangiales bacterium]